MTWAGLLALIHRQRAKRAKKHGAHGSKHGKGHHGHGHGAARRTGRSSAAKRVPHPKPAHHAA